MAINKAKKEEILNRLTSVRDESDSIVFVHYQGLSVAETTKMRQDLRDRGVGYFVAKKTLMERAFADTFSGSKPELDGEIAVAYSSDAITPAQTIKEYADKFKDNISIVGGVFQGTYKDATEMNEIATIPPLPTLRGMFVNVINSPIQGLAISLNQIAEKKSA